MSDMRLAKIEKKLRELEAKRSVALQRIRHEERHKRIRQAILIGEFVAQRCQQPGQAREEFEQLVIHVAKSLNRPKDRELLLSLIAHGIDTSSANHDTA